MENYKARFMDEFNELNDRCKKLEKMLAKYQAATLEFEPDCPFDLLIQQLDCMKTYRDILLVRAEYENIDLDY